MSWIRRSLGFNNCSCGCWDDSALCIHVFTVLHNWFRLQHCVYRRMVRYDLASWTWLVGGWVNEFGSQVRLPGAAQVLECPQRATISNVNACSLRPPRMPYRPWCCSYVCLVCGGSPRTLRRIHWLTCTAVQLLTVQQFSECVDNNHYILDY